MSCVRNLLAVSLAFAIGSRAVEVPFAFSPSTLVYAGPGFGLLYRTAGEDVDEYHVHAYGEWEYGFYRGAFTYEYSELDSLYRKSEWTLPVALVGRHFGVRGAYGVSVEWIPATALWTRHGYGAGVLAYYGEDHGVGIDLGLQGYFGEVPELVGALFWSPSSGFRVFAESSLSRVMAGYSLLFSFLRVDFACRIPGYAVSVGLNFGKNGWNIGGNRLFGGDDLDWNTFWVNKNLKK